MENKRILISGTGIAGLVLAHELKRYGFEPTLIEKRPSLQTGGYKVDIRGVALSIIEEMNLLEQVLDAQTNIQQAVVLDGFREGEQVEMSVDTCGGRVEGDIEIMRGKLCQIIYESLEDIECLFSTSISKIEQTKQEVKVRFKDGEERSFDLLIGADGLHSKTRSLAFGAEESFFKDLGVYLAVFSLPNYLNLDRFEFEYFEPRHFVNLYTTENDTNSKAGFAVFSDEKQMQRKSLNEKKSFLKKHFKDVKWDQIPHLLSYLDQTQQLYFDQAAQIKMTHFTSKRVALVGDAGYAVSPLTGQGSSVAIAGAYVLALSLFEARGKYKEAFEQYETKMKPFIKKNQDLIGFSLKLLGAKKEFWESWFGKFILKWTPKSLLAYGKKMGVKQIHKAANALDLNFNS